MTRFARAKGSKSSNERTPEDSTPWEVMKEQLLQAKKEGDESKKRKEAEQQRIENYEKFLKEHKTQKRKATWCDFPETEVNKKAVNVPETHGSPTKKKKKNKKKDTIAAEPPENSNADNSQPNQVSENSESIGKKSKKKKKKSQVITEQQNGNTSAEVTEEAVQSPKKNKKKKNKQNAKSTESAEVSKVDGPNPSSQNYKNNNNPPNANNHEAKPKKNKKLLNGKPIRRKEINDNSFQLIVHGKEIELVRFDGFPVMKKDAERLQELKNNMIKKGIPKSEVQRTMKLERRRAEKALARMKREVCYNCRKGGHVLSDCPELKSKIPGDTADGVCFKCGSTEHRQFECKVQREESKEFRFATCFICREPGHIARQCPDNPKGLYPNGGACKLCGDVTHLRKDCPTMMDKKEESSVKLHTLDSSENIEDVGIQSNKLTPADTTKKPKKITF
ncbi:hypothetical protein PYW07_005294 [Mythimna separata]|uniref:CCHC-type domain-containing protein n=1 Tax=Mythimna separata TaxID=271217 RepID=A0AAD7YF21_MYTSE|nr:hypothetical protein PYW07_005294 [Mythimna separata]